MAVLGNLIKKGIFLRESLEQQYSNPVELQKQTLRKLLIQARNTAFGRHYLFNDILKAFRDPEYQTFFSAFKKDIPVTSYEQIYHNWWHRVKKGEKDVCWPGKTKKFASFPNR